MALVAAVSEASGGDNGVVVEEHQTVVQVLLVVLGQRGRC